MAAALVAILRPGGPLGTRGATAIALCAALPWLVAGGPDFVVPSVQTPTLADAVAQAQAGDLIDIDAGQYEGEEFPVLIDLDLSIRGVNGQPRLPPLDVVSGADVVLDSVWLSGTRLMAPANYGTYPYAMYVENSKVTATDLLVTNAAGRGIHAVNSEVDITGFEARGFPAATGFVAEDGSVLSVRDGTFADAAFTAIGAADSRLDIEQVTFGDNSGLAGADVYASGAGDQVRLTGVVSTGASSASDGGSIHVVGVDLDLQDVRFVDATAAGCGGALYADGANADGLDLAFEDVSAADGGGLCVEGGRFDGQDVVVTHAAASGEGGFAWSLDADLRLDGIAVTGAPGTVAAADGGVVWVDGGSLDLVDASVLGLAVIGNGGVVYATGAELALEGGTFEQVQADLDGGVAYVQGGALSWSGGRVTQCAATNGSVVHARGLAEVLLRDGWFEQNAALGKGTMHGTLGTSITVERSRFCRNEAAIGSALALEGGTLTDAVTNTVFLGNEATDASAGATIALLGASLAVGAVKSVVRNVDFVEEQAGRAVVYADSSKVDLRNTIFFGAAPAASEGGTGPNVGGAYVLLFDPSGDPADPGDANGFPTGQPILADPLFQGWSSGDCGSNLWLQRGSPARDAGDPAFLDADGGRSDIGAYGGPDADLVDGDGDGVFEDLDCDDTDPDSFDGSPEVPYDGIDQDCDGADLVDVDVDGHGAVQAGGDDCDDGDPTVFPGATEVAYDAIDQDCDGADLIDVDGDGYAGWAGQGPDCDDADAGVHPGAIESWYDGVDQDCDGNDDDRDLDGFAAVLTGGTDCDDDDDAIHPGVADVANDGIDQDCDGYMDRTRLTGSGGFGCQSTPGTGLAGVVGALGVLLRRRAHGAASGTSRIG